MILALTCLHEAYPQQQHPAEYPFKESLYPEYQLKIQEMMKEDAARKAADPARPSQDSAAPKK